VGGKDREREGEGWVRREGGGVGGEGKKKMTSPNKAK